MYNKPFTEKIELSVFYQTIKHQLGVDYCEDSNVQLETSKRVQK